MAVRVNVLLSLCCVLLAKGCDAQDRRYGSIDGILQGIQENEGVSFSGEEELFELDIQLSDEQRKAIFEESSSRKGIPIPFYLWNNAVLPYEMDSKNWTAQELAEWKKATDEYERLTCIKFQPATSADTDRIRIVWKTNACSSYVGKLGGAQPLNLAGDCRYKDVILHELGHALGLWHEHSREDRDGHVEVRLQNVRAGYEHNFNKYPSTYLAHYDLASMMQYSRLVFSKDGYSETVCPRSVKSSYLLDPAIVKDTMAFSDVKTINLLYGCDKRCATPPAQCSKPCFVDKDCKCVCPAQFRLPGVPTCENKMGDRYCLRKKQAGACRGADTFDMTIDCRKACGLCYNADGSSAACQ